MKLKLQQLLNRIRCSLGERDVHLGLTHHSDIITEFREVSAVLAIPERRVAGSKHQSPLPSVFVNEPPAFSNGTSTKESQRYLEGGQSAQSVLIIGFNSNNLGSMVGYTFDLRKSKVPVLAGDWRISHIHRNPDVHSGLQAVGRFFREPKRCVQFFV